MEPPVVVKQSSSDQSGNAEDLNSAAIFNLQATTTNHRPASVTLATLPSLLTSSSTTLKFISDDPDPFPSGCAQPSSPPLTHHPKRPPVEIETPPLGPAFLGSLYTMGDSTSKQMVSPGKVNGLPALPPLPGFLAALNDTPLGKVVERGLLWWINRGRERPRFEFFLDRGAADKRVDSVKEGWLVPPEVSSSTVVECPLQEAWNCAKLDDNMFRLVPDKRQVRAAKRIIRRQLGGWAAREFRGTPIFAAHNFNIVMPTENGVQWYTPCFLDKSQLDSALDRSVDLHFDGLIRSRRAQRYNSLDSGGSSGGLGLPPSDAENLEEESSLLDPSDMKDLMEEAPAGATAGINKMLFHLAGVYIQDAFDEFVLGNKWARRAVGLQPRFTIFADSFEDCAAAAEAAAVAQARFTRQLAGDPDAPEGSQAGASGVRRWGPDAFKDSGPPGSTLLGDVVREVDAKRFGAVSVEETSDEPEAGSGESGRGAVDAAAGRKSDVRGSDSSAETRSAPAKASDGHHPDSLGPSSTGKVPNESGGPGPSGADEAGGSVIGEKVGGGGPSISGLGATNMEGSGDRRPSDKDGSGHQRTSEGVLDKKWWENIAKKAALQREALVADRNQKDRVVVNRGPGWEIVRRGPFWNRQYELEQVEEKRGLRSVEGASESESEGLPAGTEKDGNQLRDSKETGDIVWKGETSPEGSPATTGKDSGEGPVLTSNEKAYSSAQNAVRGTKRPGNLTEGTKGERASLPRGRSISQQEWNDVKASVKAKLKSGGASGAAARQEKWEALKASVESKLAGKYDLGRESKPTGSEADALGESSPRGNVSTRGMGPGAGSRKATIMKPVVHPLWEEFAEPKMELRPKPEGLLEAAVAHVGLAGVLRDQARMALIAVAAGSAQEKDLQGALEAVTRDIHAKPSAGAETSLMFIANIGTLFAPAGQHAAKS